MSGMDGLTMMIMSFLPQEVKDGIKELATKENVDKIKHLVENLERHNKLLEEVAHELRELRLAADARTDGGLAEPRLASRGLLSSPLDAGSTDNQF